MPVWHVAYHIAIKKNTVRTLYKFINKLPIKVSAIKLSTQDFVVRPGRTLDQQPITADRDARPHGLVRTGKFFLLK